MKTYDLDLTPSGPTGGRAYLNIDVIRTAVEQFNGSGNWHRRLIMGGIALVVFVVAFAFCYMTLGSDEDKEITVKDSKKGKKKDGGPKAAAVAPQQGFPPQVKEPIFTINRLSEILKASFL